MIREIRKAVSLPVIGIGGIGIENIHEVIDAGADGVALISAVVGSHDITRASRTLKACIIECKKSRIMDP